MLRCWRAGESKGLGVEVSRGRCVGRLGAFGVLGGECWGVREEAHFFG